LVESHPIHIPTFGVLVRTPEVSPERARVEVTIDLQNGVEETTTGQEGVEIETDIIFEGQVVGTLHGQHDYIDILQPQIWS
jgi:hypothetical protein